MQDAAKVKQVVFISCNCLIKYFLQFLDNLTSNNENKFTYNIITSSKNKYKRLF